ncbi:MAG TPA: DUF2304 domain-containing protein [Phycisphaerae bacterium]|nr:DUF2304 domain-containing protein [Phycisphaerae bacterium]
MIAQAPIPMIHRVVSLVFAALVVLTTLELIRRRKLREEYAMLWLGASLVLLVLAFFPRIPFWLQRTLRINYLTIIVLSCFLFLAMIVMHFATVISRQAEQIRQLAERMAILRRELEEIGDSPPERQADAPDEAVGQG